MLGIFKYSFSAEESVKHFSKVIKRITSEEQQKDNSLGFSH